MIKNVLTGIILLWSVFAIAQENKQYVLIEHFTNTYCPICSSRNPALYSVMDKYKDDIHHITFHPSVPYSSCPLYQYNTLGNGTRQGYYGISGTPTMFINGDRSSSSSTVFEEDLIAANGKTSPLTMVVEESTGPNRTVNITTQMNGSLPAGAYKIFVALVEQTLSFDANNGEKEHFDVFRIMITANDGDDFTPPMANQRSTIQYEYTIPTDINENEAYVVVYVQNLETKAIINSATQFDETTLDVHEDQALIGLRTWPNPVKDMLEVKVDNQFPVAGYKIYNLQGQLIRDNTFNQPEVNLQIRTSDLVSGSYLLKLEYNGGVASKRFVKQ
jgi:hypothetical protein